MSVGAELAAARERLGLSREDVSQQTKISVERLLAIEQEDLPNLPPLVYLKGFVREYATAVQLDPEQVTQRYLLEFDEPAGLIAREPETAAGADARDEMNVSLRDAAAPIVTTIPSRAPATDLFESEDDIVPEQDDFVPERLEAAAPPYDRASRGSVASRYDLVSSDDAPMFGAAQRAPQSAFRGGRVVAGVALAVLAGILIAANSDRLGFSSAREASVRSETRATSPPLRSDAAPASRANDSPAVESASRATNTRPIDRPSPAPVPGARVDEPSPTPATPSTGAPQSRAPVAASPSAAMPRPSMAAPAPDARVAPLPPRPAAPSAAAPVAPPAPTTEPPPAAPTPSPRATVAGREATALSSDNLTGDWSLTTRIELTDVSAFENMNLGFRLQLQQDGERISGRGIKWMENGKLIPKRSRTSIFIGGIRRGNRLELRFTEHGTARTTTGTFVMDVGDDGTLRGQFASTSANSSGITIARRATPEER